MWVCQDKLGFIWTCAASRTNPYKTDKGAQMLSTWDENGQMLPSQYIEVQIPRNGAIVEQEGIEYLIVHTATYQDGPSPSGTLVTKAKVLRIYRNSDGSVNSDDSDISFETLTIVHKL